MEYCVIQKNAEKKYYTTQYRVWGHITAFVLSCVITVSISTIAQAAIVYEINTEFSGATAPEATPPPGWLTATFEEGAAPGTVDLTLEATNLTDMEFVFSWLFNFDPTLDLYALSFSEPTKTGDFTSPTILIDTDSYQADGDGFFDIKFDFDGNAGQGLRFGAGEKAEYTISYSGAGSITPSSFDFVSYPDGGEGEYETAAHIGGIGPSDILSGWNTVPEPTTFMLLVLGGLAIVRRR